MSSQYKIASSLYAMANPMYFTSLPVLASLSMGLLYVTLVYFSKFLGFFYKNNH